MVEWLERFAVVRSQVRIPLGPKDWKSVTVHPAANGDLSLQGRLKAAKGEDWVPPFTCRAQDTTGFHCPDGH